MVELKVFRPHERIRPSELTLRRLNPEVKKDRLLGHYMDIASLEAYNPEDMSHDAMKPKALERWLGGDEHNMTRFLMVDPANFFDYVDRDVFLDAIVQADNEHNSELVNAFKTMRDEGLIGFVYLYNHEFKGGDDAFRAAEIRTMLGYSKDIPVWEVNTGFLPGTNDVAAKYAVESQLTEFVETLNGKAAGVYFADARDMKTSFQESGTPYTEATLTEIATTPLLRNLATDSYQDSRVLSSLRFKLAGRMHYERGSKGWKDFIYGILFNGNRRK